MRKWKMVSVVVSLLIFSGLAVMVHEAGHFWMCRILGGEANITYDNLASGWCRMTEIPENGRWAISLMGGWSVAGLYGVLWLMAKWTPTNWDLDDEFAVGLIGVVQFGYGLMEAFASSSIGEWQMILMVSLLSGVVVFVYVERFRDYFLNKGGN